jgi:phosphonate transport system permease protein
VTTAQVRPEAPRRAVTLVPPLLLVAAAFTIGGFLGDVAGGVLWGLVGGAGLVAALRLAGHPLDPIDAGIAIAASVGATVAATITLPDTPESLTPNLALKFAGAWAVAGVGAGIVMVRRKGGIAKAVNVAVAWAGAGLLAVPAAVAYDILQPLETVVGDPIGFGVGTYAFAGLAVGLIGGGAVLSAMSGLHAVIVVTSVLYLTVYAAAQVGFTLPGLVRNVANITEVPNFWPPDFAWAIGDGDWWWFPSWEFGSATRGNPLVETFRIAIISCVIGCGLALPLAFNASRITAPSRPLYYSSKGFMNVIRTIPDLFWAMLFATSVGIGPFAGTLALIMFSLAIMSKLLSETIDAVDERPLEAARATGSSHYPAIRASVLPQVLPNYVAYALYIFEINIRASVVLGIVGAGGIGRVLEAQRSFFRFDRVLAIVTVIFVIVFVIEQISVALRRRLV